MSKINRDPSSLKIYTQSELTGMSFKWKRNFLGMVKGVDITFNEDHAAFKLGNKTLSLNKGEVKEIYQKSKDIYSVPYFKYRLLDTGRLFISLEIINYESKNATSTRGKNGVDHGYKIVYASSLGSLQTIVCHTHSEAFSIIKRKIRKHEEYWKENTLFDRIMKKYFSFYK